MFKSSVSLCLVVALLFTLSAAPVEAGPPEDAGSPEHSKSFDNFEGGDVRNITLTEEEINQKEEYYDKLEDYAQVKGNGTIFLQNSYKNHVDVPDEIVEEVKVWMDILNELSKKGKVEITNDLEINILDKKKEKNDASLTVETFRSSGENKLEFTWKGPRLYICEDNTRELRNALIAGRGASAIVGIIATATGVGSSTVAPVAYAIAAAAHTVQELLGVNCEGNGVRIRFIYAPPSTTCNLYWNGTTISNNKNKCYFQRLFPLI